MKIFTGTCKDRHDPDLDDGGVTPLVHKYAWSVSPKKAICHGLTWCGLAAADLTRCADEQFIQPPLGYKRCPGCARHKV